LEENLTGPGMKKGDDQKRKWSVANGVNIKGVLHLMFLLGV
jgi:hypothetical protein